MCIHFLFIPNLCFKKENIFSCKSSLIYLHSKTPREGSTGERKESFKSYIRERWMLDLSQKCNRFWYEIKESEHIFFIYFVNYKYNKQRRWKFLIILFLQEVQDVHLKLLSLKGVEILLGEKLCHGYKRNGVFRTSHCSCKSEGKIVWIWANIFMIKREAVGFSN